MVALGRRLGLAFVYGIVLGTVFYILGVIATGVVSSLPSTLPLASFGVGFASAVAIALSEDLKESANGQKQ